MQLGMIKHSSPAGVGAMMPVDVARVQGMGRGAGAGGGIGMGGFVEDAQGFVSDVMASPDAFKYVMYAVGALFLVFAFTGGGGRR